MAGYLVSVPTTEGEIFTAGASTRLITFNNTGSYPVTIDTVSPVVDKAGIYLGVGDTYTIDGKANGISVQKVRAISVGGVGQLSIFTL